ISTTLHSALEAVVGMSRIKLPVGLLIAATFACMYANLRHARLMAAISSHNRHRSVLFDPALHATRGASVLLTTPLFDPFSIIVLFFSGTLRFASIITLAMLRFRKA
ncbi:hypothetical protein CF336_g8126, partial [Tilletia laevis]